jgi:hypothetical protein
VKKEKIMTKQQKDKLSNTTKEIKKENTELKDEELQQVAGGAVSNVLNTKDQTAKPTIQNIKP